MVSGVRFPGKPPVGILKVLNLIFVLYAGVAELADALDLGSSAFGVGVRLPSPAPILLMIIFVDYK